MVEKVKTHKRKCDICKHTFYSTSERDTKCPECGKFATVHVK